MRYMMKQKLFALGGNFQVKDENGNIPFVAHSKMLSIGAKLSLQDTEGRELALIRQSPLSIGVKYEIHRNGTVIATVTKELFSVLRTAFTVKLASGETLHVEGDFSGLDYAIKRGETVVARVSKKWFSLVDTYGIDISEGEDTELLVSIALVIESVIGS